MSPANANDSHLRSELPGVAMALRTIAQRLRMRRRARLRTWRHAEGWAQAGRAGNADPVQRICPLNQPTLVANSELSAYSWARRFAQPAPTRKFSLTMGAKRGVLVGPANSPPVSQPQAATPEVYANPGRRPRKRTPRLPDGKTATVDAQPEVMLTVPVVSKGRSFIDRIHHNYRMRLNR